MKRKAIQLANQTLVISMPSKWVKEQEIKKGDEIDVEERGRELIISKENKKENKKEGEINLPNSLEVTIRVLITDFYRLGYDKVKINFNNPKEFETLQKIVKTRLIGFDVIKKDKNYCIIENITEPSEDQFDNILKKLFLNIEDLFELTKDKLNKNYNNTENLEDIEERIHKYNNFCRRVISKKRLNIKNSEMFCVFLAGLVNAQRELYHLNVFIDKNKNITISKEVKNLLNNDIIIFNIIKNSFFKKDINELVKIHEIVNEIVRKDLYPLLEKDNKKENVIIYHLSLCIRQLHLLPSPLIGSILG